MAAQGGEAILYLSFPHMHQAKHYTQNEGSVNIFFFFCLKVSEGMRNISHILLVGG